MKDILFNDIQHHVYEGVWQDHNKPSYKSWIWTVRNSQALIVLALFALLITLSQRQAWNVVRNLLSRWKGPVFLRDDDCSNPLQHLSQYEAMKDVFLVARANFSEYVKRLRQRLPWAARGSQPTMVLESTTISPYFGIFAFTNIIFYIIAGILLPWLLSEGWQDAPVTRVNLDEGCVNSTFKDHRGAFLYELPRVDAAFQGCRDQAFRGCERRYFIQTPKMYRARSSICPFKEQICLKGIQPVVMTHYNLTAFEAGINLKSRIRLNRRLACTPINLLPLMVQINGGEVAISVQELNGTNTVKRNTGMKIATYNGPNRISKQSSGRKMALQNGPRDISVLPHVYGSTYVRNDPSIMSNYLWRDDGESFVIVHRAGPTKYVLEVDDPFFSAHQNFTLDGFEGSYSDHEATGLGCFEQMQYCLVDAERCSRWGRPKQLEKMLLRDLELEDLLRMNNTKEADLEKKEQKHEERDKRVDQFIITKALFRLFSMYTFLGERFELRYIEPPILRRVGPFSVVENDERWVYEVDLWYRKAYLNGIFRVQDGARWNQDDQEPLFGTEKHTLCGRVILRDKDHTNINVLGLCICSVALCLLCLSNTLAVPTRRAVAVSERLAVYVWDKAASLRRGMSHFTRNGRQNNIVSNRSDSRQSVEDGRRRDTKSASKPSVHVQMLLKLIYIFKSRSRNRSTERQNRVQPITLYNLENSATASHTATTDLTDMERFEDIDNVI